MYCHILIDSVQLNIYLYTKIYIITNVIKIIRKYKALDIHDCNNL